MSFNHFNLIIIEKPNSKINKDNYLDLKFKNSYDEETITAIKNRVEFNYDLNMKYLETLDFNEFNNYLLKFVKNNRFIEVDDLSKYRDVSGNYILVLDKYKQVYIGQSNSITKRIRNHWSRKKCAERLIWGNAFNSILSIDSFGA